MFLPSEIKTGPILKLKKPTGELGTILNIKLDKLLIIL
jgi:hypothetical protein